MAPVRHRWVGRENIHTYWSNELPPRLWVDPGDTVTLETLDSSYGRVARRIGELAHNGVDPALVALISACAYPEQPPAQDPAIARGHPLTGPVGVRGAQPGDTLVVEIMRIEPGRWGHTSCHSDPDAPGLLNEFLGGEPRSHCVIWDLRSGDHAELRRGIRVPLAPFCGVMGVAPAESGSHSTVPPRRSGGNMDLRHLTEGATLLLPVLVPGALLSIGDAHGAQGDGEVSGTGIEMEATVTVRLTLRKDALLSHPRAITNGRPLSAPGPYYVGIGNEPDLRTAARTALRGVLEHLVTDHGLSPVEAYVLASACVDLKISQLVDMPNYTVSAYLPLSIFS